MRRCEGALLIALSNQDVRRLTKAVRQLCVGQSSQDLALHSLTHSEDFYKDFHQNQDPHLP